MQPNPEINVHPERSKPKSIVAEALSIGKLNTPEQKKQFQQLIEYYVQNIASFIPQPDLPNLDPEVKTHFVMEMVPTVWASFPENWQKAKTELDISERDIQLGIVKDLYGRIGTPSFKEMRENLDNKFGIPPAFYDDPLAKKEAVRAFYSAEINPHYNNSYGYKELFSLSPEFSQPIIEDLIARELLNGLINIKPYQVRQILSKLDIPNSESDNSEAVLNVYKKAIDLALNPPESARNYNLNLKNRWASTAANLLSQVPLLQTKEPELTTKIKNAALTEIKNGSVRLLWDLDNQFLPTNSPDFYQAVRFGINNYLNDWENDGKDLFRPNFLPEESTPNQNDPKQETIELISEILQQPVFKPLLFNKFENALMNQQFAVAYNFSRLADISSLIKSPQGQSTLKTAIFLFEGDVTYLEVINLIEDKSEFIALPEFQRKLAHTIYKHNGFTENYRSPSLEALINPETKRCILLNNDLFGEFACADTFNIIQDLFYGRIPEELAVLGVTKPGKEGIEQFKHYIEKWLPTLTNPDLDLLIANPLLAAVFKSYIRYESSSWGKHDNSEFMQTLQRFQINIKEGNVNPLQSEYQPSAIISIDNVDKAKRAEFEFSEGFLKRYSTLKNSIVEAKKLLNKPHPLVTLGQEVDRISVDVIQKLEIKAKELAQNPKAVANINQQISRLNEIKIMSYRNLQQNFSILGQFPEFAETLRRGVFLASVHRNPAQVEYIDSLAGREKPQFEDISWMINFIDHITNKETFASYFKDKYARKTFNGLTDVKALEEELARMQGDSSVGTTTFQFIPTRGILMEFSGHIADACWASKYDSITSQFPNISTVLMVKNPQNPKTSRLAGAAMLIETTAKNGTPVLVIRGLNPQENVINSLVISDYYQKFTDYCKSIAKARGRELLMVIDNRSGGASTNRPALFQYLYSEKTGVKVPLASADDSTFNGYNIVDNCYLG